MGMGPLWTDAEVRYLREHMRDMSWSEIARALGRPHTSVRTKAMTLGLRKLPQRPGPAAARAKEAVFEPPRLPAPGGPARLEGEPVITERTRIVRAPAPVDPRYQPERRERVVDAAQCRPWAQHATRGTLGDAVRFDSADVAAYVQRCRSTPCPSTSTAPASAGAMSTTAALTDHDAALQSYFRRRGLAPKPKRMPASATSSSTSLQLVPSSRRP